MENLKKQMYLVISILYIFPAKEFRRKQWSNPCDFLSLHLSKVLFSLIYGCYIDYITTIRKLYNKLIIQCV